MTSAARLNIIAHEREDNGAPLQSRSSSVTTWLAKA